MATEKYRSVQRSFETQFDITFDADAISTANYKINSLKNFTFKRNAQKEIAKNYLQTLSDAVELYLKSKTSIGDGQYYDAFIRSKNPFTDVVGQPEAAKDPENGSETIDNESAEQNPAEQIIEDNAPENEDNAPENEDNAPEIEDDVPEIALGKFINGFEELMQEKYMSDVAEKKVEERDRKPFEGLSYEAIAKAVFAKVNKIYNNKSMVDVWVERITHSDDFFETLQKETKKAEKPIDDYIRFPKSAISRNPFIDGATQVRALVTAKKAMERVVKGRGFWWRLWIGNWDRRDAERELLQSIKDKLDEYKSKGLSDELLNYIMGDDSRPVLHGTEKEVENSIQEYKESLNKETEVSVSKDVSAEKITTAEQAKELFASEEYKGQLKGELLGIIDLSKSQFPKMANDPGVQKTWFNQFQAFTIPELNSIWKGYENASDDAARDAALANGAKNLFTTVERHMSMLSIPTVDKYVEAQKVTDFLLKKYTPVALDEKYAQYADKYFLRNTKAEDMPIDKEASGKREDIIKHRSEILAEACEKAGIEKVSLSIPDLSENVNSVDKTEQIKEPEVPKVTKSLE